MPLGVFRVLWRDPGLCRTPFAKTPCSWFLTELRSCLPFTIRTETITNENLGILFRFRFRNGKANKFPQIFFCICFRNDHVGHAQATTAGPAYEIN